MQVDFVDAVTPLPAGDMYPCEIRNEAGKRLILSGGISPFFRSPGIPEKGFIAHVKEWLDLKTISLRLIMSDGDRTPREPS